MIYIVDIFAKDIIFLFHYSEPLHVLRNWKGPSATFIGSVSCLVDRTIPEPEVHILDFLLFPKSEISLRLLRTFPSNMWTNCTSNTQRRISSTFISVAERDSIHRRCFFPKANFNKCFETLNWIVLHNICRQ